jgi:class 3 adenylate cyclase/tetratricopeptide (TPR) repeat protein
VSPDPYLPYVSRVPLSWVDSPGPSAHWLDGTLVFVDVAGFTALSERLARQGRAGAEELTDLLGVAFAQLLAVAYDDGGSLLSFGGDALLIFFTGPDHARRGAHAAAAISRKPAELGALPSSAGPVRLKLSMGAHSGRYCFLATGEESRVVMLLGEDVTRTVRLEQRANGGQVLLGASLALEVPEAVGEIVDGAALLLRRPRPPLVGDPAPLGELRTPASRFLSPMLREHIAGQASSEHRRVAVGFLQLRGTDALLARDALGALEAVDEVVRTAQSAAAEYGVCILGSDVDADGAKLMLVAGAPRANEHEEERLLRMCRAVLDLDTPLALRAGVTAGHVFAGDVGPPYRRTFTVMGERVNLAARLMGSAAPGELRTTPSVLAASSTRFDVTALDPLVLKGIREPVEALVVGAAQGQVEETGSELFGRDDELRVLREALERPVGGSVELVGDAGSGKSALLATLLGSATCPTLRVAAAPYETATPFGLVKRVLRYLIGVDAEAEARETGRRVAEALSPLGAVDLALILVAADGELDGDGPAAGPPLQDDLFAQRLARAVRRTLELLVPGKALLVVEDVQWADPSSIALLRSIADHLRETPWLLCASRRPSGSSPGKAMLGRGEVLWLAPLTPEAATALVHHLTVDTPMTPHRVAALVARSGGNPLFLTELVRVAGSAEDLPESVEAVVHARLDALPTYLRTMLRQAAVLGVVFDLDLLSEIAGFVPDRTEWRQLEGLLERHGSRGEFSSDMYREVAYASLLFRARRALHREAGRILASRGSADVELLALHAAEAQDDELTWRYAASAGHRAAARGAHEAAVTSFERAVVAHHRGRLGAAAETVPVLRSLGDALLRAGRPGEAQAAYRKGRGASPRGPLGDPSLLYGEAKARYERGELGQTRRWITNGLRAAVAGDDDAVLQLLELEASLQLRQGKYVSAERTCQRIIDLTEGTDQLRANAHARDLLHLVLTTVGDPRRAQHRSRALEIYTQLGDVHGQAHVLNNLGMDAYYEGRWTEASELFERSRVAEEEDANDVGAAVSDMNAAEVLLDQGTFDPAHERLMRALRTFLADDFRIGTATVFTYLGRLETRRGRFDEAASHLRAAREAVTEMGADSLLPDVVVREAELAVCSGLVEAASERLDELDRLPDVGSEMRVMSLRFRAAVAARQGQDSLSEQQLREAVALETGTGRFSGALARHSLAVVLARRGDPEAETHRHAALESLRRLGVHQFRDPLAGDDLVVIALPPAVVDLTPVLRVVQAV